MICNPHRLYSMLWSPKIHTKPTPTTNYSHQQTSQTSQTMYFPWWIYSKARKSVDTNPQDLRKISLVNLGSKRNRHSSQRGSYPGGNLPILLSPNSSKDRGLSTDFHALLSIKENTSNLKCVVDIFRGRVWFGTDFGVWKGLPHENYGGHFYISIESSFQGLLPPIKNI